MPSSEQRSDLIYRNHVVTGDKRAVNRDVTGPCGTREGCGELSCLFLDT